MSTTNQSVTISNTKEEKSTYNGWKNYETWLTALWLDNSQASQTYYNELAQEMETYCLAQLIQSEVEESNPLEGGSMYEDLLRAALSEVCWYEIASNYKSETI